MKIQLKRVYDPVSIEDGFRILVERLWPRGIKKSDLKMDRWLKDVAPSPDLRKWYSHDVAKWDEFQKKYVQELEKNSDAIQFISQELHKGPITFLYSARDKMHNSALCLKHYLEKKRR